jgi:xanthine/CO dehydrogenase XdhC/CoxF family maturation factor
MRDGQVTWLIHDLKTGELRISAKEAHPGDGTHVERIEPPRRAVIFGATPLAARVHAVLTAAGFDVHISDWRQAYLDHLEGDVSASHRHLDRFPVDERTHALILSHSFERDRIALREALEARCPYIGVLSSPSRRDRMYDVLSADGVERTALERVSCPVGLRTGGTDGEIAVGIAAEILKEEA